MENLIDLLIPVLLILVLIRIMALPVKLLTKIVLNSACGFACLWLLNWISGFTGIYFPINAVTAAVAGFLGLPGIALLAAAQLFL